MHQALAKWWEQLGLVTLESHHEVLECQMKVIENEIVDNLLNQTVQVCLSSVSNHTVKLPNKTVVAFAPSTPVNIFTLK